MSDLVKNPADRFTCDAAHIFLILDTLNFCCNHLATGTKRSYHRVMQKKRLSAYLMIFEYNSGISLLIYSERPVMGAH